MPYANNNGVRIHYQVEGEGPPLTPSNMVLPVASKAGMLLGM